MDNENILLKDWDFPPFTRILVDDYAPAVRTAIAEAEQAIETIATSTEKPTFENTIVALELADHRLSRITAVMDNLNECCTSEALQQVVMELQPEITRFATRVSTDERLFSRVEAVYNRGGEHGQRQTLLENTRKSFMRHGVALKGEERKKYMANAEKLSQLELQFGQNALADRIDWTLHLTDEADLEGLPSSIRAAAQEDAHDRGLEGWIFTLEAPSYAPFMQYSARRNLREQMWRAYGSIGNRGGLHDNNEVIRQIVTLRDEQAQLLGYATYCDYVLEDRMVQSLPNLQHFMGQLREAVLPSAQHDIAEVAAERQSSTTALGADGDAIMPWDFAYYAECLRKRRYDFDEELMRPYFPLEAVRDGIFALYGQLYGVHFTEDDSIEVYHPDVKVYRVEENTRMLGWLYLDMFPRASKRSGAWMTEFRGQHGATRPQIQVVCNFSKPTTETPSLLRFSEVETFMHEMGHAMHGMLSEVDYESLSGTNVKRDFVEMPSQVMENWCYESDFLATFARHWQTGEALPTAYIDRIRAARNYLAGWYCLRQLNLGQTDIAFHTHQWKQIPGPWKAEKVEQQAMLNLLPRIEGCCTATGFSHIFDGGYASGYYGYKWAEVLDADIFGSRFQKEGIFNRQTATEFREKVLSRGGSEHPALLFRHFMGRDPDPDALLRRMGITPCSSNTCSTLNQ